MGTNPNYNNQALRSNTALQLGDVFFLNWEVPERIERFGGYQKLVVHDMPGGERDVQKFGYYPPDIIRWSGVFNVDPEIGTIDSRMSILEQMVQLGDPITLSFSRFSYEVVIHDFIPTPTLETWIPYTIELVPVRDLNRLPGPPTAPGSTAEVTQVAQGMGNAPGSPLPQPIPEPSTGFQAPIVAGPSILPPGPPPSIPTAPGVALSDELTEFQRDLFSQLQSSTNGNVSSIPDSIRRGLVEDGDLIRDQLAPLIAGSDTGLAAFASQTDAGIGIINNQLVGPTTTLAEVNTVNPNLMELAQEYFGDASQWPAIANYNTDAAGNKITTPNPVGTLTIKIPTPKGTLTTTIYKAPGTF